MIQQQKNQMKLDFPFCNWANFTDYKCDCNYFKQKIQKPDFSSERTSLLNLNFIEMINIDQYKY